MRIAVNATNISSGGGLNHLIQITENLNNSIVENDIIFVWASHEVLNNIPSKPFIIKKTNYWINSNTIFRSLWVFFNLKKHLIKNSCHVLFTPGGNNLSRFNNVVIMSRNILPFELSLLLNQKDYLMFCKMFLIRILTISNFKKSSGIIFLNDYILNRTLSNKYRSKSIVIPHGVNHKLFCKKQFYNKIFSKEMPCKIIYPSSFFKYKNHELVIQALQSITSEIYLEVIFVGDLNTLPNRLKDQIINFKSSYVTLKLIDYVSSYKLNLLYENSDIGLFASKCENLPNTLLEMMAKGMPIIASDFQVHQEVLGSKNVFFNLNNYNELKMCILKLYNSLELRTDLANYNFTKSKNYNWKKTTVETLEFLRNHKLYVKK